jgi:arabinose-5-phosphate isomerase
MTRGPKTIAMGALVERALAQMEQHRITCLFVVDPSGNVVGALHLHDLLRDKVR